MFNLGMMEIVALGGLALLIIGPKQLPEVARVVARLLNEFKQATRDLSTTLADVKQETSAAVNDVVESMVDQVNDVRDEFEDVANEIEDIGDTDFPEDQYEADQGEEYLSEEPTDHEELASSEVETPKKEDSES